MKKLLVVGLVSTLFSAGAFAAVCAATATTVTQQAAAGSATTPATGEMCVCNGGTAFKNTVNGGAGVSIATPIFAKTGFDVQCSANTIVSYNEISGTAAAVASGSRKGNQRFKGSTAGGGISLHAACASTNGCIGTDVTAAMAAAVTDAGS